MELKKCNQCHTEYDLSKFYNGFQKDKITRKYTSICHYCRYQNRLRVDKDHLKKRHLKKTYNLTLDQYEELLRGQGGVCAVCRVAHESYTVDHDHSCCAGAKTCGNCVRGVLCHGCNRGMGQFKDDTVHLQNAIDYLNTYKSKTPS